MPCKLSSRPTAGLLILAASGLSCHSPNLDRDVESATPPTPIVVITIDTLRADRLGCYGYFRDTSPTIDRLASDGVLFERAVTTMSLTLPAHTSMWTSLHPLQSGVLGNAQRYQIDPDSRNVRFLAEILAEIGYATSAVISARVIRGETGIDLGFQAWDEPDTVERRASDTTDIALRWLGANQEHPFFLWVHYFDPHSPYDPPEPFNKVFQTTDGLREYLDENSFTDPDSQRVLDSNNLYDGEILYLDSQIARLLNWLEQTGLYEESTIVLVGDHGEGLGQHDWFDHGRIHNEQLLVPLIIKFPEHHPHQNERHTGLVSIVDLIPILADQLALPVQQRDREQFAGMDVLGGSNRSYAFSQRAPRPLKKQWDRGKRFSLITEGWKLEMGTRSEDSLFDLRSDPGETTNVIDEFPTETMRLRRQLEKVITHLRQTRQDLEVSAETSPEALEQLKALGYLN